MENWIKGSCTELLGVGGEIKGVRPAARGGGLAGSEENPRKEMNETGANFAEFLGRCRLANRFKHEISLCPVTLSSHAPLIMTAGYRFPVINLH